MEIEDLKTDSCKNIITMYLLGSLYELLPAWALTYTFSLSQPAMLP